MQGGADSLYTSPAQGARSRAESSRSLEKRHVGHGSSQPDALQAPVDKLMREELAEQRTLDMQVSPGTIGVAIEESLQVRAALAFSDRLICARQRHTEKQVGRFTCSPSRSSGKYLLHPLPDAMCRPWHAELGSRALDTPAQTA